MPGMPGTPDGVIDVAKRDVNPIVGMRDRLLARRCQPKMPEAGASFRGARTGPAACTTSTL
jgi:hypothetical protein